MKTIVMLPLSIFILLAGCISEAQGAEMDPGDSKASPQTGSIKDNITIEVYHFHGTRQCQSCIKVGELAEKTVNTYFKDELDSGTLVFGHINGELPENSGLVEKYGVTSSSLWIGTYVNGEFHKEQNVNVWYKINNEQEYLDYLKTILETRLSGGLD